MSHDTPLIATIVIGLTLAFILGTLAQRMRLSPIVGYLVAGIAVGPFTQGFVANQGMANELAEIGIILLMLGVGLHFSVSELLAVRTIAVPGALFQILCATALGLGLALWFGWPIGAGLVFGLALSVASSVVLLRALQERHLITSQQVHIAVGWLIVEELVMILRAASDRCRPKCAPPDRGCRRGRNRTRRAPRAPGSWSGVLPRPRPPQAAHGRPPRRNAPMRPRWPCPRRPTSPRCLPRPGVQLARAGSAVGFDALLTRPGLAPADCHVVEGAGDGAPTYLLLWSQFPDADAARAAARTLPGGRGAFVPRIGPLQSELRTH